MYDLDGLAIDSLHRYKSKNGNIDLEYWRENDVPEKIMQDSLMPMAQHLKDSIADSSIYVIIATARACFENDANYDFLNLHFSGYNKFIHRQGVDDTRGGAEIKIKGMKRFLGLKQFRGAKFHVYEDNHKYLADVCYAMRDMGFSTVGHFNPSYQGH
jgi:hypothetical protein